MGSLYNGIGLNTVKSIRNRPPSKNVVELKGYAIVYDGDAANTTHVIYEKSEPIVLNYRNTRVVHKPLKIPSNASILQVFVRNLSNGRANYVVNSNIVPTYASSAQGWAIKSHNIGGGVTVLTYVNNVTDIQLNNGIVYEQSPSLNSDSSVGYQNAALVNISSAVSLAVNTGTGPYNSPTPPGGATFENPVIVEIVFTVEVP